MVDSDVVSVGGNEGGPDEGGPDEGGPDDGSEWEPANDNEGSALVCDGSEGISAEVALLLHELFIILTAPVEAVSASTKTGKAYSRPYECSVKIDASKSESVLTENIDEDWSDTSAVTPSDRLAEVLQVNSDGNDASSVVGS